MANGGFKVTTRQLNPGWAKKIAANIQSLAKKEVAIGFPRGDKAASITYDNGMSVLDVAVVNQFGADIDHPGGTPYMIGSDGKAIFVKKGSPGAASLPKTKPHKIRVPARAFMDQGTERIIEDVKGEMASVAKQANRREISAGQALKTIGVFGEKCIQEAITDGTYEPNATATVRRKKSNKPLINSGNMRRSVASVVRDRTE